MTEEIGIILFKYLSVAFIVWTLFHLKYPVINKDEDVKYPKIKVNLIGQSYKPIEVVEMCGVEMLKKGYSEDDVKEFVHQALMQANREDFFHYIGTCFYIY